MLKRSFKCRVTPQEGQEGGIPLVCATQGGAKGCFTLGMPHSGGNTWHKKYDFIYFFIFLVIPSEYDGRKRRWAFGAFRF
jgi:hypothetical protein